MTPTPEVLVAALGLPPETRIDLRVAKKELAGRSPAAGDRRLVHDGVESCTWIAVLKPTTTGLAAVQDAGRDYGEIAVVLLAVRDPAARLRLRRLLHRIIPYPLVLIDHLAEGLPVLSLVHRRRAQNGPGVVLAGEPIATEGLAWSPAALAALSLAALAPTDLHAAYDGWIACCEAMQAAAITGVWAAPARIPAAIARRRAALARHAALAADAATHARAVKQTRHLAQVVEANLALQAVRQQQRALFPDLSLDAP